MLNHPDVLEVAVIGEPHELSGERAKAFVVPRHTERNEEETEALQESLRELVENLLPETHWLGNRIVLVFKLPRSSGGKLLKRLLKKGEYTVI